MWLGAVIKPTKGKPMPINESVFTAGELALAESLGYHRESHAVCIADVLNEITAAELAWMLTIGSE